MIVAVALLGYAVLLLSAGAGALGRARWADRSPRLAVAAWLALTGSSPMSPIPASWEVRVWWSMVTSTVVASPPWRGIRAGSACSRNAAKASPRRRRRGALSPAVLSRGRAVAG